MGRPRSKNSVYFIEDEMVEVLKEYRFTKSEKVFEKIEPKIVAIINGMINKEFSYNTFIKGNREAAISECMIEILKSYHRFDPDKGRLYAYTNRIVKNTLIKFYNKNTKLSTKEITYTDLNSLVDNEEDIGDDNVFKLGNIVSNEVCDDTSAVAEENALAKASQKNVVLDSETSVYIIYTYLIYIVEAMQYYLNNKNNIHDLIKHITYDYKINFDFTKYYYQTNISADLFYFNLIENLNFVFNNLLQHIKCKYNNILNKEPETFDGKISNRVIGNIKKFIVNSFNDNILSFKFNTNELISFVEYIVKYRYIKNE